MCAFLLRSLGIFVLALSYACVYAGPPIQLAGTPRDLDRLAGEWWGEYVGDRDHRRSGSIVFKLVAGEDHAHGDVLMTPEGSSTPFQRHQGYEMGARPDDGRPQVLTIRFVRAEDGGVTGALDPYWDPDRGSQATTIFRGRLIDDTIEGTFTTRYASGMTDTAGRWRVMRQR